MPKKPSRNLWQRLKALLRPLSQTPQADFVEGLLFRHALLYALPHLLVRIELGRVRRQGVQLQNAIGWRDVFTHQLGFMNRMTIDKQENELHRTKQELFEESAEYRGVDENLVQHEL